MAGTPPPLEIRPPLINTACPWATTLDDLRLLYKCPSTGAVTTRTSLIDGFDHDLDKHQYAFFGPGQGDLGHHNASINSLGYSPLNLQTYLDMIKKISDEQPARSGKGFIVSVTGTPEDIATCYKFVASAAPQLQFPIAMEINLSCPNIPNRPPPAYSEEALATYLAHLQQAITDVASSGGGGGGGGSTIPRIPVGLKTPPYTYSTQYEGLISALDSAGPDLDDGETAGKGPCPISFITATNTLGSCLVFSPPCPCSPFPAQRHLQPLDSSSPSSQETGGAGLAGTFALPGAGLGGLAGAPLHPLALGNVATLRRMLDERSKGGRLAHVRIVGVGGVLDAAGYRRMRAVGADVVGVATGLGLKGVGVFGEIEGGLGKGGW